MSCRKSVYVVGGNNHTGNFFNDSRTLFTVEKLDTFKWQVRPLLALLTSSLTCPFLLVEIATSSLPSAIMPRFG